MLLKKYIRSEILKSSSALLLVLLLIFSLHRLVYYLRHAASGELSGELIGQLLLLQIPRILGLLLPLGLFLGSLLALARMYADQEINVMRAVGLGHGWLMRTVFTPALILAMVALGLTAWLTPWATAKQQSILDKQRAQRDLVLLKAGRFHQSSDGRTIVFVYEKDSDGRMKRVFMAQIPQHDRDDIRVVTSDNGQILRMENDERFLVLDNGEQVSLPIDMSEASITKFGKYLVSIPEPLAKPTGLRISATPTEELWAAHDRAAMAELQWRISSAISVVVLMLVAVPLARTRPREGQYARLLPALAAYLVYIGLLSLSRNSVEKGHLPMYIGLWWVHLVALSYVILESGIFYRRRWQK